MTSVAIALPDPQSLAAAQVPGLVLRVTELRDVLLAQRDAAGADDLRRRLAAYERYVVDKKARAALEAESRRTEVLIGELLGEPPGKGTRTDFAWGAKLKIHHQHHADFYAQSQHPAIVEDRIAAGITARAKILVAIEQEKLKDRGVDVESGIRLGDFREVLADIPDESVDLIFTDPPYEKTSVNLYPEVAEFGLRVLKPGASLLAYCGQYALPQILSGMGDYLRYWWMCACVHDGGNHKSLPGIKTYVLWKPIVWYVKQTNWADEFVYDAILRSTPDKTSHDWAQSLAEPLHYIEKLCPIGGLVCDPFAGGGTTAIAAKKLGRRFVGAESNAEHKAIADGRIAA